MRPIRFSRDIRPLSEFRANAAERRAEFPASGRVVPEVRRDDIREVIGGEYRIIYRIQPAQVSIFTVHHSRQLTNPEDGTPPL